MKIERVETFQADAGWRMFSFLKVTTSDGIIGWSEFNESFGSIGLSDVIRGLSPMLIGKDPRRYEQITQHLHVLTRQSRGGINQQAIAAIENALLDVTGKEQAHTLLRQSVRYAVRTEQSIVEKKRPAPEIRALLPKLLD